MSKRLKKIKLSQIRLETAFRNKEKDLSLELSINRHGLKIPLIVEEESENQYVLVDGYRRFYSLKFLEKVEADCSVESLSSEEERIVKRLRMELHTKKRTAYQLEKMIGQLIKDEKYDVKSIASYCSVTEGTITKYIRGSDVNPDWLRRGEQTGAGRHAFTEIQKLNVDEEIKNYIADKYIERQINKSTVDIIKKAFSERAFKDIPRENLKECLDQIIEQQSKGYEPIQEIVMGNSLQAGHFKNSHTFMYNLTLKLLTRTEKIFSNSYYVNYLSKRQKNRLIKSLKNLLLILNPNPPITWSGFPVEAQLHVKSKNENGDSVKTKNRDTSL